LTARDTSINEYGYGQISLQINTQFARIVLHESSFLKHKETAQDHVARQQPPLHSLAWQASWCAGGTCHR